MKISREELDKLKCLHKQGIEKLAQQGFIEANPFKDVDCKTCQNYHSAILCGHYINQQHIEDFKRLYSLI